VLTNKRIITLLLHKQYEIKEGKRGINKKKYILSRIKEHQDRPLQHYYAATDVGFIAVETSVTIVTVKSITRNK